MSVIYLILILALLKQGVNMILNENAMVSFIDNVLYLTYEATSMLPNGELWTGIVDQSVQTAIRACELVPPQIRESRRLDDNTIKIIYYDPNEQIHTLTQVSAIVNSRNFDKKRNTVIYTHGWRNGPTSKSTKAIIDSLHKTNNVNVILLDSSAYVSRGYIRSIRSFNLISKSLYRLIKAMVKRGVPLENIEVIGYSLGSHVAGAAGKMLSDIDGKKLERITALDPAAPCFTGNIAKRIDRSDAKYVEVFHTTPGLLGIKNAIGHADIYVNGVSGYQPQCRSVALRIACGHSAAWEIYIKSIRSKASLVANKCDSWSELRSSVCESGRTYVGFGSSKKNRGLFLLDYSGNLTRTRRSFRFFG